MGRSSGPVIEPVSRLKVADVVATQLSRLIEDGEYAIGEKLPSERELSEQFGVGRSSMREALRSLQTDGLIRVEHGVGAFVGDPRRSFRGFEMLRAGEFTVPELFEVRLPLERDAAGLAARRITAEACDELWAVLDRASKPETADDEFIALDAKLHRLVAAATRNALLLQMIESVEPLFYAYSHHVIALPGRRATAHEGHVKIVEAVTGRRVRDARAAAVAHIRDVEKDLVAYLARSGDQQR